MNNTVTALTLEVQKDNWAETRLKEETLSTELNENEVVLRVDKLALTANNISYAASGDSLDYWGFSRLTTVWGESRRWVGVKLLHPIIQR